MKDNFLSLMGMRLRGCRMNDPEITQKFLKTMHI